MDNYLIYKGQAELCILVVISHCLFIQSCCKCDLKYREAIL